MGHFFELQGQSLPQIAALALAFLLSALIGTEREIRHKSAGLRTHTLVGVSAALFMLVSKYGFMDILVAREVVLDPSRVAAQVVSGIGFIGGGVIFMRRDIVRGLTTAASIWFTAAVGMACGAGLFVLALATMLGYFVVMLVFPVLEQHLPSSRKQPVELRVCYEDGHGLLRNILVRCTGLRFSIDRVGLEQNQGIAGAAADLDEDDETAPPPRKADVTLTMTVRGNRPVSHLVAAISDIQGVREVSRTQADDALE